MQVLKKLLQDPIQSNELKQFKLDVSLGKKISLEITFTGGHCNICTWYQDSLTKILLEIIFERLSRGRH